MNLTQQQLAMRALVARELEHAEHLLELLAKERTTLGTDGDAIEALANAKAERIEQLEQLHAQRVQLLRQAGCDGSRDGMDLFLRRSRSGAELRSAWQQLLETISACRDQNQINGIIVESTRRSLRDTLSILQGQQPDDATYGENGYQTSSNLSRSWAKA